MIYFIVIAFIIVTLYFLISYKKLIYVRYKEVDVTIEETEFKRYRSFKNEPSFKNNIYKNFYMAFAPASYKVFFKYNEKIYCIDDIFTYFLYRHQVGCSAKAIIKIKVYEDNIIKEEIVKLK